LTRDDQVHEAERRHVREERANHHPRATSAQAMPYAQHKKLHARRRGCVLSIASQLSHESSGRGESALQLQRRSGSAPLRALRMRLNAGHHG
jgi:hypothetical protein